MPDIFSYLVHVSDIITNMSVCIFTLSKTKVSCIIINIFKMLLLVSWQEYVCVYGIKNNLNFVNSQPTYFLRIKVY